ncbi:unnamed protein product [Brassica oleracea]
MAGKFSFVSVMGALLVLTIFHDPIIVDAGQGVPEVALFTFGDSYYDAGNKAFLSKNKNPPQTLWPYGKSRDDPNGKFSDGYIVPDFIAEFMSIPNGIPPALKPGANVSRGASFAVADASILGAPAESGEPSFYLFGFIMYCSHSCESAERDNRSEGRQNFNGGVWEKATHKEARLDDLEALKLDKCSGSSLPMDFQDRLNTAGTDLLLRSFQI